MIDRRRLADAFRERARARLADATPDACREDLARWAAEKMGYRNAPHHLEWYGLVQARTSLCIIAPRDSAKSECFTVNNTAWRSIYRPGHQSFVFAATDDLATKLKRRIDDAIRHAAPALIDGCKVENEHETVLHNAASIRAAGAGKAVRGAHPDLVVGDDVLEEEACRTHAGREKVRSWWLGTVEGMRHPGTRRRVNGREVEFPPTRVVLVGTPFHADDLLMGMRSNTAYCWRRYASEFDPDDLIPGTWALEANDVTRRTA